MILLGGWQYFEGKINLGSQGKVQRKKWFRCITELLARVSMKENTNQEIQCHDNYRRLHEAANGLRGKYRDGMTDGGLQADDWRNENRRATTSTRNLQSETTNCENLSRDSLRYFIEASGMIDSGMMEKLQRHEDFSPLGSIRAIQSDLSPV